MDLLQLKYFQDAANTENFSQTAAKFMVPPSCISLYIKKLETELDTKLFDRVGNRVRLNDNGKLLLSTANNIFLELDMVQNKLSNTSDVLSGEISMLIEANRRMIISYIGSFKKDYPQISFKIEHKKMTKYSDYDIVITSKELDPSLFEQKTLVKERFVLAVCSEHPLAQNTSVYFNMLENERFISMQKQSSMRESTDLLCALNGFTPQITIESDDPSHIRTYVSLGLGVALVPEHTWDGQYPDNVVLLPLNGKSLERETKVYWKKHGLKIAELFVERLKQ